jgi:hypothetical protein
VNWRGREQLRGGVEGELWGFDGGDWLLINGKAELDVLVDQSNASAADLERLSWGWRGLELVWLWLRFRRLWSRTVPIVKHEVSGEGDGQMGAFGLHSAADDGDGEIRGCLLGQMCKSSISGSCKGGGSKCGVLLRWYQNMQGGSVNEVGWRQAFGMMLSGGAPCTSVTRVREKSALGGGQETSRTLCCDESESKRKVEQDATWGTGTARSSRWSDGA